LGKPAIDCLTHPALTATLGSLAAARPIGLGVITRWSPSPLIRPLFFSEGLSKALQFENQGLTLRSDALDLRLIAPIRLGRTETLGLLRRTHD
jgi:hypothetical protein